MSRHQQEAATFDLPDCLPRTAVVVLTYLLSPRLPVALRTWMSDAALMRFDIILMVSATQNETNAFRKRHTLPLRVSIENTWALLRRNDTQYLERWKTQAFFGTLVEPERYDWYVMLDDDTLPNFASLTRILCLLHGGDRDSFATRRAFSFGAKRINATGGLYMGWTPKGAYGYVFATGQGFLMDQQGVRALKHRMLGLSRVNSRESCHSQAELARMPRCWWWAHNPNLNHQSPNALTPARVVAYARWRAACCAVDDGLVRSFDYFIGTCLATTNVSLVSIGDSGSGWWPRLFHHGGMLKRPEKLQQHATRARQQGWEAAGEQAHREGFGLQGGR